MSKLLDLTNKRFGKLIVTGIIERRYNRQVYHKCICDCGNINWVQTGDLTHNRTTNCGCSRKLEYGKASRNRTLKRYQRQAEERNLSWDLTDEQFDNITSQSCYFCGILPNNKTNHLHSNGHFVYNGIDRLNNKLGYTIDNVVPCCKFCNRAKGTGTLEDFTIWLKHIKVNI